MKNNLHYYHLISRLLFPRSYIAKIILVAIIAMHGPLTLAFMLVPSLRTPPGASSAAVVPTIVPYVVVPMVLLGTILMAVLLRVLLQPVTVCSQSLRNYMDRRILPQLPTNGKDQAGILMSDLQHALTSLDQLIKEQEQRATHDPLTEIGNRAWSDIRLHQDIMRAGSNKVPVCLCMIDVDHFKEINDVYGHDAGDRVLQQMVRLFQEKIRGDDWVARWGGDEFIMLLWNCDTNQASSILNRIRISIQQANETISPNPRHHLSISVGLCEYDGVDETKNVFLKADSALYAAKMRGRDCIVPFHPELPLTSEKISPCHECHSI